MLKLPLEPTFNEFVLSVGGELIVNLLPKNDGRERADYLFRSLPMIAELKCLEKEIDPAEHARKLQVLIRNWQRRGLLRVYGTAQISLQSLPKPCQDEWLDLYEDPIQSHVLSKANRQIREAKESLGLPEAKGVVLIANEAQFLLTPPELFGCISRILKKTKPDRTPLYSSIDRVVLFSANVLVESSEFPHGVSIWLPAYRTQDDETTSRFLVELGKSWTEFCAAKRGRKVVQIPLSHSQIENLKFAKTE